MHFPSMHLKCNNAARGFGYIIGGGFSRGFYSIKYTVFFFTGESSNNNDFFALGSPEKKACF